MSSKEFILGLSDRIGTSEEITSRIVKYVNKCIGSVLESGRAISVAPIGVFSVEKRMERVVIDPATKKRMLVPPQNLLKLSASVGSTQEMASLEDVSEELSRLSHLPIDVAETIVSSFFGYIQIALNNDDILTVDGLGHFQTAAGSQKIIYTPSDEMNELVNRPFSQFVPVILNDGVFFADIEDEQKETNEINEQQEDQNQNRNEHAVAATEDTVNDQQPTSSATTVEKADVDENGSESAGMSDGTGEQALQPSEDSLGVTDEATDTSIESASGVKGNKKRTFVKIASASLLLAGGIFGIGYLTGHSSGTQDETVSSQTESNDTLAAKVEKEEVKADVDIEAANELVKYGAYRITRIDTTIVVAKTQTVRELSAMYFGGEQMEMYIKALNGGRDTVEARETLLIPHLELK